MNLDQPLKRQPHKMVKRTRQQPTNCLSVFDHFVWLALKGLNNSFQQNNINRVKYGAKINL